MLGENIFGEFLFGGNIVYIPPDSDPLPFSSGDFLPEYTTEDPLYESLIPIFDYMITKYHYKELQYVAGLYDVFHANFDADKIVDFIGGSGHVVVPLTDDQKRGLCLLLSSLYELKGMRSAIELIIRSMDIPGYLYEKWEIDYEVETGKPSRPEFFPISLFTERIEKCSIAIVLDATGRWALNGVEDSVRLAIEAMSWVCARIRNFFWIIDYRSRTKREDFVFEEYLEYEDYFEFCIKIFGLGENWCFLPKPIIECTDLPIGDRTLIIYGYNGEDDPIFEYDEYDNPIILDEGYEVVDFGEEENPFLDEYGNLTLLPWKFRPNQDAACCPQTDENIVVFMGDEFKSDLYEFDEYGEEQILVEGWNFEATLSKSIQFVDIEEDGHIPITAAELGELNWADSTQIKISVLDEYGSYNEQNPVFYLIKTLEEDFAVEVSEIFEGSALSKEEISNILGVEDESYLIFSGTCLPPFWREVLT